MNFIKTVQPPLAPLVPRFRKWIFFFLRGLGGWIYVHWLLRLRRISVVHMDRLVDLFAQFQEKKIRLIIAFRHPTVADPSVMFFMLSGYVRRAARRSGRPLKRFSHACFIYDRGIPIWLGAVGKLALPGLGGISLYRGKIDPAGLRKIRMVLLNGEHPLGMAPEGATTYHVDVVGSLNAGVAHFGFWCAEDLHKAQRTEEVLVVPISVKHFYRDPRQKWFASLIEKIEAECFPGEQRTAKKRISAPEATARISRIRECLIAEAEEFYARFYHHGQLTGNKMKSMQERIDAVTDAALKTAESFFNVSPADNFTDRQHVAEQAAWNWIYRDDIPDAGRLSVFRRAMADRIAAEASLRMHHVQLADILMYIRDDYCEETSDHGRYVEALANCDGIMARLRGGDISHHTPRPQADVEVLVGEPLSVSQRMADYRADRKKAVSDFMADLNGAYLSLIREHRPSKTME